MIEKIRKRNGYYQKFDSTKITDSIFKAAQTVGGNNRLIAEKLTDKIVVKLEALESIPTVEQIQDLVEKELMEEGFHGTARAFILYRDLHNRTRNITSLVDSNKLITDYLNLNDWKVKENANQTYSLSALNFYISNSLTKQFWLNSVYDKRIREAHNEGYIHIHDLGLAASYCIGWDLKDLLVNGFTGVEGKVSSKPAKHLRSALGQVTNFFFALQAEAAGAQAFSDFDVLLAPFIKKDCLSFEEVKQAVQEFVFSINVATRSGFQAPFTNVTLDFFVPEKMKELPAIVGGKPVNFTYGDCQKEVELFDKALAEVLLEGDGNGRPFSFPIPTINLTKNFDWDNDKFKDWWRLASKYGTPYFANYLHTTLNSEDVTSMCCRLRIDKNEIRKRNGGLFASEAKTGSIGVVTINLPLIAFECKGNKEKFYSVLNHYLLLAKNSLKTKRRIIERFTSLGLYPYIKFYMRGVKQDTGKYWDNHFSTIGLNGMNEMCLNFLGENITSEKGKEFGLEVMNFVRNKIFEYQKETNDLFNFEASPAESVSHRFALLARKKHKKIVVAGTNENPYFTNSCHAPVNWTDDIFEYLVHQEPFQVLWTGGTVIHVFVGEAINGYRTTKNLVRKIAERFESPYFSITPTFSICPKHGYLSGKHLFCPNCDAEIVARYPGAIIKNKVIEVKEE